MFYQANIERNKFPSKVQPVNQLPRGHHSLRSITNSIESNVAGPVTNCFAASHGVMRKIFARKPSKRPSQFDTAIRTQIHFRGALSKTDISFSLCGDAVDSLPMRSTLSQRRLSTTLREIYRQHLFPQNFFVPFSYREEQLFVVRCCSNFNQVSVRK